MEKTFGRKTCCPISIIVLGHNLGHNLRKVHVLQRVNIFQSHRPLHFFSKAWGDLGKYGSSS